MGRKLGTRIIRRDVNPEEERYCQNRANAMGPQAAYNDAYGRDPKEPWTSDMSTIEKRPTVKARIDELLKDRNREFFADKKYVLDNLKAIVAANGPTSKLSVDALHLIGKEIGMFVQKIENTESEQHSKAVKKIWDARMAVEKALEDGKAVPFKETPKPDSQDSGT